MEPEDNPGTNVPRRDPASPVRWLRLEESRPDDLAAARESFPIAWIPLGTIEHHGWHLPVGFDGLKAHALCERAAARCGGVVWPTLFFGTGGGHLGFPWTIMVAPDDVATLLDRTVDHLAESGFRVVVLLTGHYPGEQVDMVDDVAARARERHPGLHCLGIPEHRFMTPDPGDAMAGDHAAKYETSLALALNPQWVDLSSLVPGRDPNRVRLPSTPLDGPIGGEFYEPASPLFAIAGADPREHASAALGRRLVEEFVAGVARWISECDC